MALRIPMTFAQCLLDTIMETAFLSASRIWKLQCLRKARIGRKEPIGLVVGGLQPDGIGDVAATMVEDAGFGATCAGGTIASVSVAHAGIVAGPVGASGGAVLATASGVNQLCDMHACTVYLA